MKKEDLIKERSQILSNSTELGTIVPGGSRDYIFVIDWNSNKQTTLLALWFQYTFLENEKDANVVIIRVAGGWNQNDMSQRRYAYEEIKKAEAQFG